jgi:hypothetical protein
MTLQIPLHTNTEYQCILVAPIFSEGNKVIIGFRILIITQNSQTSNVCILQSRLRYFVTKLHNFTKFMMLFPTVPMKYLSSKIQLKGERSIDRVPLYTIGYMLPTSEYLK